MSDDSVNQHPAEEQPPFPLVAIILVNYNGYRDTARCLDSLAEITYAPTRIIVVHNGCHDNSDARLREEFPSAHHIVSKENLGFTGGNNLGIEFAMNLGVDHVLLINNDTIVTPHFLEPLVDRLLSNPTIGAVSGKIYYAPEAMNGKANVIWYAGCFQKWHTGFHHSGVLEEDTGNYDVALEVPYASGCLMLMRGDVLRLIGPLSDDYFLYWEEADWCWSAKEHGFRSFYEPKSVIYHNFQSAQHGREKPLYMYMQTRNAFIFARKHYRGLMKVRYAVCYPLYLLNRYLFLRQQGNQEGARAMIWGVCDALLGFVGTQGIRERGFKI